MSGRGAVVLGVVGCLLAAPAVAVAAPAPAPPSAVSCAAARAHRYRAPIESYDPRPGAPRVFAMQFKQELRNVVSYGAFATKVECMIRDVVLPRMAHGRPNVVVFNEDIGLMTIAIGTRGEAARRLFGQPGGPSCEGQGVPCATVGALGAVTTAYAPQIAAYHARFPAMGSVSQAFVGATDTLVRGFAQTFSELARRYGVYIVGSADIAPFTESSAPADIATFADPDLPRPASVFVATAPEVYNQVFMWGPRDIRGDGPGALRNVVASNRKVPLTPIENELQFTPGPSTGPDAVANIRPYQLPGTLTRIGFATSLPAFVYGSPPAGTDPCSDTGLYYMRCLDELGANLVLQDEANPGRWTGADGDGIEQWQPLSWMSSTWRTASDPSVGFSYNVTAMMVGNLADLPFDGQTAIVQRGLSGVGCHYIGNASFVASEDRPDLRADAGAKPEFLALAPWVAPDGDRATLRALGARLAPGSGDPAENDYLETAIVADLPEPVDRARAGCATAAGPQSTPAAPRAPRRCRSLRAVTITLRGARSTRVRAVVVLIAGRRVRTLRGDRRRVRVSFAGRRAGPVTIRLRVVLASGRVRLLTRTFHLCRPGSRAKRGRQLRGSSPTRETTRRHSRAAAETVW